VSSRTSAFKGTFNPNARPYVSFSPDAYVSIQGETNVIACGECRREIDFNKYITQISTEGSVDSPPGSATITLSVPDTDVNDFFVDGEIVIMSMMEIEIYGRGYFTVGGIPQYYRIFWGIVSSVSKSWSSGSTFISISCKDILRWWELTNITINPAFLESFGSSAKNYQLFQNQFAGMNPYSVIIALAKEAMGDFSLTTGSFNQNFRPEFGQEQPVIASYAKDIMAYWQLKFGNIWNSLVLYGTSGQAYTFSGQGATASATNLSKQIFEEETRREQADIISSGRGDDSLFKIKPGEVAAFKLEVSRAGDIEFFQSETQSKLSVAMTARDQIGYEFYCDTTGDIIFKPPFYNLNVIPNKPTSWIRDIDIIDDTLTENEADVYTHITASGNSFGGVVDWGLNDEITTPRTGVFDYHLLRRYGWRRYDYSVEWAGNPTKLFFHLLDYLDRMNARRQNGTITIPMRPELRMGFPVWIPLYESFYYIQGISHQYSVGGQATTTLTLIARRSKFVAPDNIGRIEQDNSSGPGNIKKSYKISFPNSAGSTSGLTDPDLQVNNSGKPRVIRDPQTGKKLGFPNVVMVFHKPHDGASLNKSIGSSAESRSASQRGNSGSKNSGQKNSGSPGGPRMRYEDLVSDTFRQIQGEQRAEVIKRLRAHRYETGMTNAGSYDYAWDVNGNFKEIGILPLDSITFGEGTEDPNGAIVNPDTKAREELIKQEVSKQEAVVQEKLNAFRESEKIYQSTKKTFDEYLRKTYQGKKIPSDSQFTSDDNKQREPLLRAKADKENTSRELDVERKVLSSIKSSGGGRIKKLASLNVSVRPVSDEFGFEVIGHQKYGRGAFIDRGQIKVGAPDNPSNQLNTQFAPTGGLLTDPILGPNNPIGPGIQDFAKAFEELTPDDYVTGASFETGANSKGDSSGINPTGQATYSGMIQRAIESQGSAVFTEADALRKSKSLVELRPTLNGGLSAIGFENCSCMLGKTDWLSILPSSAIAEILSSSNGPSSISSSSGNGGITQSGNSPDSSTPSSPKGFFDVLRNYLTERFRIEYEANNSPRENKASGVSLGISNPNNELNRSTFVDDSESSLFNRASNGDIEALKDLQQEANFNFGRSAKSINDLGKVAKKVSGNPRTNSSVDRSRDEEILENRISNLESFVRSNPFSSVGKQELEQARKELLSLRSTTQSVPDKIVPPEFSLIDKKLPENKFSSEDSPGYTREGKKLIRSLSFYGNLG
jgi:hypothetical protein